MIPIGPLMVEHRLIERFVDVLKSELSEIEKTKNVYPILIDQAVDFFRTYADRTHHGKEEDILFRDLAGKNLSAEHEKVMNELVDEHINARKIVGNLVSYNDKYRENDKVAFRGIIESLKELIEFYPNHINKEDKKFFYPCMEYFNKEEKDAMLSEFWEFDKNMIHEKYRRIVDTFER
jgi:hemerythrin-like domain-containing protein